MKEEPKKHWIKTKDSNQSRKTRRRYQKEAAKKDAARQERRQNDRRNNDNRRGGQGRNQNDNRRNNDNQNRGGNKFESKPSTEVFTAPATSGKTITAVIVTARKTNTTNLQMVVAQADHCV